MPRIFPPAVSLQLSRQSSGWETKWKHPCQQLFKPVSASSTVRVDQTLLVGLFVATATSILIIISQSWSRWSLSDTSVHVHVVFPSIPDYFRVTGKLRETHSESISNYIQKDWFFLKNIHSILSMSHEFSFIHLQIFFLFWKVIQKYGYIQEVGEDVLLESLISVWEYLFSDFVKVVAILLL